jgi:hypothetical protein
MSSLPSFRTSIQSRTRAFRRREYPSLMLGVRWRFRMSPEFPFGVFVELFGFQESMLIHSAFLALLFDGHSKSVTGRNIPIVAALKSPANKACHTTRTSGGVGFVRAGGWWCVCHGFGAVGGAGVCAWLFLSNISAISKHFCRAYPLSLTFICAAVRPSKSGGKLSSISSHAALLAAAA